MRTVLLDFSLVFDKESAHTYIAYKLAFPSWYGKNADALHDCLSEIGECTIVLRHPSVLAAIDETLLTVFRETAEHRRRLHLVELDDDQ